MYKGKVIFAVKKIVKERKENSAVETYIKGKKTWSKKCKKNKRLQ